MIYETCDNVGYYFGISPLLKKGLEYLVNTDLASLPVGKIEIDGDNVYAIVSTGISKPYSEAKMEAHRKYIDIQFNISGKEDVLYWFLKMNKGLLEEYPEKDLYFYNATGRPITIGTGRFAIFFPTDLHAPGLTHWDVAENKTEYKKIVIKVKI